MSDMGQKTERATPKRRREAREKGNVLKSHDLSTALVLLTIFASLKVLGAMVLENTNGVLRRGLVEWPSDPLTVGDAAGLLAQWALILLQVMAPLLAVSLLISMLANYIQVGVLFTTKTLKPKFERVNPLQGFKRIFSIRSVAEMIKSILKVTVLGVLAYQAFRELVFSFAGFLQQSFGQAVASLASQTLDVAIRMSAALIFIGAADYFYQWWKREREMRMSKQEVKDEFKLTEGDPQVKGRIRQKQRQIGMMRMMQAIPTASVVITNPTHYAVALRYRQEKDDAPIIVAKGKNEVARRIRERAREHGVELVENRPLAQALYFHCEVGDRVPRDLYKAVAEVLAYVYRLKNRMGRAERRERTAT